MAKFGSHLLKANLVDIVHDLSEALNAKLEVPRCLPSSPFTNGLLLDLFRTSKTDRVREVSVPRRLVELLHGLGYIPSADSDAEKKWLRAASSMFDSLVTKNLKKFAGVSKQVYLDRVRECGTIFDVCGSLPSSESIVAQVPHCDSDNLHLFTAL